MWSVRRTWLVCAVLAGTAAVGGCSSHTSSAHGTATPTAPLTAASASSVPVESASASSSVVDPAVVDAMKSKMLDPSDVGLGPYGTFSNTMVGSKWCDGLNPNPRIPPVAEVSTGASSRDGSFGEDVLLYGDEATAAQAFDAETASSACSTQTSAPGNSVQPPVGVPEPKDVSSAVGADQAVAIGYRKDEPFTGLFIVRAGNKVVEFRFLSVDAGAAPPGTFPDTLTVVRTGIQRLTS